MEFADVCEGCGQLKGGAEWQSIARRILIDKLIESAFPPVNNPTSRLSVKWMPGYKRVYQELSLDGLPPFTDVVLPQSPEVEKRSGNKEESRNCLPSK
jgi:hypothetical protein